MFFRGGTNGGLSFWMTKTGIIPLVLWVKFRGPEPGSPSAIKTGLGSWTWKAHRQTVCGFGV